MAATVLRMGRAQFDAVREHGEATYPHESCGVLLGHAREGINEVVDAVRTVNIRTDSAHNRYQIAPQELIRIQREGRERGLDIVGFYHSHPNHPAQWSRTDLTEAHWFGCSYVITSVEGESGSGRCRAAETNSFFLVGEGEEDKRLEAEPIEIVPTIASPAGAAMAATVGV